MKSAILLLFLISINCIDITDDLFTWPGWPEYQFKTWSGLIDLDDDGVTRNLHYVFVESQSEDAEVATQPIILWLNGGPGCSSMLGLMQEIGPFVIDNGETDYKVNPWSWNNKAHILVLESPFGVGFSQPTPDKTYQFTDAKTGTFNYQAIRKWFDTFTYYRGRPFWIAGESYAGMYIPYTAKALLEGEATVAEAEQINFKGVMIGNGVLITDEAFRDQTSTKYLARRSFIDLTNQFILNHNCVSNPQSASCKRAQKSLSAATKDINPYNVYGYCWGDSTAEQHKTSEQKVRFPYTPWLKVGDDDDTGDAPCIDFGPLANVLNTQTMRDALHVDPATTWSGCSGPIYDQYVKSPEGSYQILPQLFLAGKKILLYSGDQDLAVSMVETQESILKIPGIQEVKGWTPYRNTHPGDLKDQLVGWTVEYNMLSFYVIRAAGHMVPQDQRENSFFMVDGFING